MAYDASQMMRGQAHSGVYVNHALVAPSGSAMHPCFSPDGKRFAVAVWICNRIQILVNGSAGPVYDEILDSNSPVIQFEDDHTLRLLAVKEGSVFRVSLDLGS